MIKNVRIEKRIQTRMAAKYDVVRTDFFMAPSEKIVIIRKPEFPVKSGALLSMKQISCQVKGGGIPGFFAPLPPPSGSYRVELYHGM
jgi:hypothetical protein